MSMKTTLGLLALTLLIPTLSLVAAAPPKPNIMVFLVDDMGVMDTSVPFLTDDTGQPKRYPLNDYYRTPGMERLAERGIRFSDFYAMSVCSPTRISIMTGQNAARHHATNWINPRSNNAGPLGPKAWMWKGLKKGDVTLPGLLKDQGYKTIHIGKAHFGPTNSEGADPSNLGFDVNIAGAAFGAPGSYYGKQNYGHGTKRSSHAVPHLAAYHGSDTYLSEALTLEAKKVITQTVSEGQPFYLYFSHYAVHSPFHSDPRFADHYTDSGKPKNAQAFATMIEGMDKSLGDMLDLFEASGIAENTLVFFLGDNGTDAPLGGQHTVACAAPLRGKKGAHYEGGMRVPFIAAWVKPDPDNPWQKRLPIAAGALQSQSAAVHDILPTLLALIESAAPADHIVDGSPMQTLLSGGTDPERPQQFLMHYPHGKHRSSYFTTWRDGDWKVIYHEMPEMNAAKSPYQLFNLADDPFEQNNLATTQPEVLQRMMGALIAQLEAHEAQYPQRDGVTLLPKRP